MTTDPTPLSGFSFNSIPPAEAVTLETVESEPFQEFDFDLSTSRLRVAGYSITDVAELLALYRDHMERMAVFARDTQQGRTGG